jgi:DNA-binding NarL/FixJ family response regulator
MGKEVLAIVMKGCFMFLSIGGLFTSSAERGKEIAKRSRTPEIPRPQGLIFKKRIKRLIDRRTLFKLRALKVAIVNQKKMGRGNGRTNRQARAEGRCAVIVAAKDGRIRCAGTLAIAWVNKYFPKPDSPEMLPASIRRWLSRKACSGRLEISRNGDQLLITLVESEPQGPHCLVLEESCAVHSGRNSDRAALTPREVEVLSWVAQGKANWAIGKILDLSSATVRKHLQHIYAKLGVENRTAAALCAVEFALAAADGVNDLT